MTTRRLDGTVALVTAGTKRLGRAIVERLAAAGADVVVHFRSDEKGAAETVDAVRGAGRRCLAVRAELADEDAARRLVDEAEAGLGPLGLLVNNAAVFHRTPLDTMEDAHLDLHLASNTEPVYALSLHAGRRMKARGGGAIVNLADVAGVRPWAAYVPYSASKGAVVALTRGFARALAPEVRVNAVAPGPMLPPAGGDDAQGEAAVARTLLQRWGSPADVAEAVLFLATSPYLTGVLLPVDGGRSIDLG